MKNEIVRAELPLHEIGTVSRRDLVGLRGRGRVTWLACLICSHERWVMNKYAQRNVCVTCHKRDRAYHINLNSFVHKEDCRCGKCRAGKGYYKGEKNPMWAGGFLTTRLGYILEFVKDDSPFSIMKAYEGRNYVMQHRLVMATHLGRPLTKEETVHHKNGIKSDNNIENLELWATKHHSGQRVNEMLCPHCGKNLYSPVQNSKP